MKRWLFLYVGISLSDIAGAALTETTIRSPLRQLEIGGSYQTLSYLRDDKGWYADWRTWAGPSFKTYDTNFLGHFNYALGPDLPATVPNECGGIPANPKFSASGTFRGTGKADLMKGTDPSGSYTFLGLGGADILCGSAGPSTLNGGPGNDILIGGPGNDTLVGLQGQDVLEGGPGDDFLEGEPGIGISAKIDSFGKSPEIIGYQGPDGIGGKRPNYTVYRFSGTGNTGNDIIRNFRAGDVIELVGRDTNQDGVVDPYDLVPVYLGSTPNGMDDQYYSDGGRKLRLTVGFIALPSPCKVNLTPNFGAKPCVPWGGVTTGELAGRWQYPGFGVIPYPFRGTITFVWDKSANATDWKNLAASIRYRKQ